MDLGLLGKHAIVTGGSLGIGKAIAREKEIKGWLRAKKVALVESRNPSWRDLSREWGKRFLSG